MSPIVFLRFQITAHGTGGGLVALVVLTHSFHQALWLEFEIVRKTFFRSDVFGHFYTFQSDAMNFRLEDVCSPPSFFHENQVQSSHSTEHIELLESFSHWLCSVSFNILKRNPVQLFSSVILCLSTSMEMVPAERTNMQFQKIDDVNYSSPMTNQQFRYDLCQILCTQSRLSLTINKECLKWSLIVFQSCYCKIKDSRENSVLS